MGLFDLFSAVKMTPKLPLRRMPRSTTVRHRTRNLYNQYKTGATGALTGAANTAIGTLGTGLTNTARRVEPGTDRIARSRECRCCGLQSVEQARRPIRRRSQPILRHAWS